MKFGTALLFNARADWLDSYVDYEALKKAIPEPAPAAQRAVRPATSSYTDLEAAPLLRTAEAEVSSGGEIAKGHQPFFKLLDKELRKIANFYEDKERELLRAGEELDRDLREEEERDLERVKEESWDPADSGLEPVGDADENEGESHLGSLGGFANTHRKNRSRSRSRITNIFQDGNSPNVPLSDRDTTDLFEAQQSYHAARLRNTNPYGQDQPDGDAGAGGDEHDDDSSPENSPRISTAQLSGSTDYFDGKHAQPPAHKRSTSDRSATGALKSPMTVRRRIRRSSLVSSSTSGLQGRSAAPGELGLVPVDPITLAPAAPGTMSTMHASTTSDGFHSSVNGVPTVQVWTSPGQHASMLKILYKRRIAQLWFDWTALASFRELNQEGVKKAVKKFDKITGSKTKDYYLDNSLTTYYPYLPATKHLLEAQDKHLLTTYARVVVGGDRELASRQLGSQLREKVVIERDTVWRQMVHASRTNDTAGGFLTAVPDPRSRGAAESKERWQPIIKTPLGTLYRPAFITRGAALFSLGLVILALLSSGAIPTFERVEERNCCAMLVFCTILWATEAIPLFVTSLAVPFLVVVLRVLRSTDGKDERLSANDATKFIFSQMFSPTIMLLIGGFTIAAALSKTRMDAIMAKRILNLAGTSPSMVLLSQMGVATFASMWISNVAAPTLCFALIKPITEKLPPNSQFTRCLIIAIALASNIGGQASPISSPQNLIALQAMEPELDWLQWFAISLPVASLSILLIWGALHLGYRWEKDLQIPSIKPHGDKFTGVHWFVLSVTLGTIGLWCIEKSLEQYIGDMGIIAIIPLVAFFGTGVLSKDDFHHFQWSIVYLAMGGIALGKAVLSSGLLEDLDAFLEKMVGGLSLWQILAVFSLVVMVIATFISHTIAAVLLVPIASRIGESLEDPHPRLLIMATALICSAGMGLPVSGFPNMSAIAQEDSLGNRYLDASDFLKNGIPATILATLVIVGPGYFIMRLLGL